MVLIILSIIIIMNQNESHNLLMDFSIQSNKDIEEWRHEVMDKANSKCQIIDFLVTYDIWLEANREDWKISGFG